VKDPKRLHDASIDAIYDGITRLSDRIFRPGTAGFWRDEQDSGWFAQRERFYLIGDAHDELVGWTGYFRLRLAGRTCVFYDTAALLPSVQRSQIMTRLYRRVVLHELTRSPLGFWAVALTQSPVVYCQLWHVMGPQHVYPSICAPTGGPPLEIARSCSEWLGTWKHTSATALPVSLNDSGFVLLGAAARWGSPDSRPTKSGNNDVDAFFERNLTWTDSLVVLWRFSLGWYFDYFFRQVRRGKEEISEGSPNRSQRFARRAVRPFSLRASIPSRTIAIRSRR
jgi:hypothetical protein